MKRNPLNKLFSYFVRCPLCGVLARVRESIDFWLLDTWWRCGNCEEEVHRDEMKDETPNHLQPL